MTSTMTVRAGDGTALAVGAHPCDGEGPVVLVLHGLFSHMGWYRSLAQDMAAAGAAVYLVDRRGAGLSEGRRGHMPRWTVLVHDVTRVVQAIRTLHPGRRLHALGISLGGTISLAASILHPGLFESQILLSPGLAAGSHFPLRRRLRLLQDLLLRPAALVELPFAVDTLTDHPAWRRALHADPLRTRQVTARFLFETVRMQRFVRTRMNRVRLPLLVLLAEKDQLVDNAVALAALRRARSARVRIEVFAGAAHILPASVPPAEMLGRFTAWLHHTSVVEEKERSVVTVPPFAMDGSIAFDPPPLTSSAPNGAPG